MGNAVQSPLHMADFIQGGWRDVDFAPFKEGVEIHMIREENPAVALLRYAPGAVVPRHEHTGLETIIVLDGEQSDERGDYPAGSLVLNPPGTQHSVWSDGGCVILIQWEKPVQFVNASSHPV